MRLKRFFTVYAGIASPVLALVILIGISGFLLLRDIARDQDLAYETNSRKLIENSLEATALSNQSLAIDYAYYTAAYENITLNFSEDWLVDNYSTEIASAIGVHRAGEGVIFSMARDQFELVSDALESLIKQASDAHIRESHKGADEKATDKNTFVAFHDSIAIVSMQPVQPETKSGLSFPDASKPIDHAVFVTILGPEEIAAISRTTGIGNLRYIKETNAAAHNKNAIELVVNDRYGKALGRFEWPNLRPGTAAFSKRILPITLGLLIVAFATIIVVRGAVAAQMRALKAAKTAAEDANKTKSSFLASVSHELRTPLNAIIGYSELIEEDSAFEGNEQTRNDARKVTNAAQHLLGLINDLLDHSKIEAGKMDLNPAHVELTPIFIGVGDALQGLVAKNNSALHLNCDPEIGAAMIDGMRFKQCLLNLVSNAAKFTRDGKITLSARGVTLDSTDYVRVSVKDTGIGMSEETLGKLFAPFVQADAATATRYGGTGLGLVITRALIEAMGGRIEVESEVGVGSTFTLLVPRGDVISTVQACNSDLRAIAV